MQGRRERWKKSLLPKPNKHIHLIPQILSNDLAEFMQFDQYLQENGYEEFNWNLGCPMRMVTRKKRGSGLLPYPQQIEALLENLIPKLKCHMSIKVRLGLKQAEELISILPMLNRYPIQMLIIHPRLGEQGYSGNVDLDAFEKCLEIVKHPVVYNGDMFTVEAFRMLEKRFPQISQWMLGRGVLANPFLPGQIKGEHLEAEEKLEKVIQLHSAMATHYESILSGPAHMRDKQMEYWFCLYRVFEDGEELFRQLKKAKQYEVFKATLNRFLASTPKLREHIVVTSAEFAQ
jgi:tRNA-dihydrouridine synthase B